MDQQQQSGGAPSILVRGIIGLVTAFIGLWLPAIILDAQAMAGNPAGWPGATLIAVIISPVPLILGPAAGILFSGRKKSKSGRRLDGEASSNHPLHVYIRAGVAGLVVGLLPYAVIALLVFIYTAGT